MYTSDRKFAYLFIQLFFLELSYCFYAGNVQMIIYFSFVISLIEKCPCIFLVHQNSSKLLYAYINKVKILQKNNFIISFIEKDFKNYIITILSELCTDYTASKPNNMGPTPQKGR